MFQRTIKTTSSSSSITAFYFANATEVSYNNFWSCYANISSIDATLSSSNSNYQSRITQVSTAVQNFVQNVEAGLNCNGICYYGLFYYFQTLAAGPPTQNCVTGLTSIFGSKPLGIGILLLISFLLTLFTFIASWSMCCRCCAPKETKDTWNMRK